MLIEDLTKRKGGSLNSKSFKPWSRKVTSTWKTPAMTPLKKLSGNSLSTGSKKGPSVAPAPGQDAVTGLSITKPSDPSSNLNTTVDTPKIDRPRPAEPGQITPGPIIKPTPEPKLQLPDVPSPIITRPKYEPTPMPQVSKPNFGGVATDIPDPAAWELYQQQHQKKNAKKDPYSSSKWDSDITDQEYPPDPPQDPYSSNKWDSDITDQEYPPDPKEELPLSYGLTTQGGTGLQATPDDSLQTGEVSYWLDKKSPFQLRKEGDGYVLYNKENALYPEKSFGNKSDAEFEMAKEIKKYLENQGYIGGPQYLEPIPQQTNQIPQQQTNIVPEQPNGLNQIEPLPKDEKQDLLNNFNNDQLKELQQSFTSTLKSYLTKLQTLKQKENPKQSDIDLYTKAIDKIRQKLKEIDNILSTDKVEDKELTIDEKIADLGDKLFDKDNKKTYNQEVAKDLLQALESKYDLSGLGVLPTLYDIESSGGTDIHDGMDGGDSIGGLQANVNGSFADWKALVEPDIEWKDIVNNHGKAMEIGAWYYRRLLNYTNKVSPNWDSISNGEITFVDKNGEEFDKVSVGDVPIELVYAAIYYNGGYSSIDKETGIVTIPLSTADLDKEKEKNKPYIPRYEYAVKFINRYPK